MKRRTVEPLQWGDPRCKLMTAAILVRKSTATEGRSKSCDQQEEVCRADCERFGFGRVIVVREREGCHGEWYWDDDDVPLSPPHREELGELVRAIKRGEVQVVVAFKLNRLVRDVGVWDALSNLFLRYGVRLIVGGRDLELETARGKCDASIEAARSREWRDEISENVQRDHDYKFRLGLFTRNPSCYGFRSAGRDTQGVVFIYEELRVVRRIFDMACGRHGGPPMGHYQIARRLMDEGVTTAVGARGHKTKRPGRVDGSQVRNILQNCMYVGLWQHNKERKTFPQLFVPPEDGIGDPAPWIPQDLWDEAQARLSATPKLGSQAGNLKRMLSGLVVCGACGRPCHAHKTIAGAHRWICPHRSGRHKTCTGSSYASIRIDELDQWVLEYLAPMLAIEVQDVLDERLNSPLLAQMMAKEAQLAELKEVETKQLKMAMRTLDEYAFTALARSLREEREQLELEVADAKRLVSTATVFPGLEAQQLWAKEPEILKGALTRCLRWVALTDMGVLPYTKLGSYTPGRFVEKDLTVYNTADNHRTIAPPDEEAWMDCQHWITDKSAFAAGRRYSLGTRGERLPLDALVPDWA
jgi:DNA invertase Pin-like site-specific DNA recombinase